MVYLAYAGSKFTHSPIHLFCPPPNTAENYIKYNIAIKMIFKIVGLDFPVLIYLKSIAFSLFYAIA